MRMLPRSPAVTTFPRPPHLPMLPGGLALSIVAGGVTAVTAFLLTGMPLSPQPVVGLLLTRPQLAFSILIGPTGLTFPCWAANRARTGRRLARAAGL